MAPKSFRFASFTLDLDRLSLNTPSGEVKLRPKTFEVLRYLLENPGRVVSKQEVMGSVWSGLTVTEESLTRCISEVRRALGDEGLRIVRTVPKRGYLLDVRIASRTDEAAPAPTAQEQAEPASRAPLGQGTRDHASAAAVRSGEPERRQLTVMVCSMVGLAGLAAGLDPEDLRKIVSAYYGRLREVVEHRGGCIAKHLADGVLAYFGYPHAHEDDAERAVGAGLAATQAVSELSIEGLSKRLQARVGIATGLVVVGEAVGNDPSAEPTLIGETAPLAAQLVTLAAPGAVVISSGTRRIVGRLFECRDLSAAELIGAAEPVQASAVLREGAIASRFEALRGAEALPLVGREEELGALAHRWEQAKGGTGRVVLLAGEGGIGKSRIAWALRDRLAAQPHMRLVYHCSPFHRDTALHPVITQFTRVAGIGRDDSPEVKLGKLKALLASLGRPPAEHVALFASLLSIPGGDRYRLPDLTPQEVKERTVNALMDLLRGLCYSQPVLAVYEDLHWIDPTSLELLSHVVEEASRLRLLLVGTARPEFTPPWPNHWHTDMMALTRLAPLDAEALIGSMTQGKALPAEVVAQIVARTDGVPLFIEELTKTVLESGMLRDAGDRYELTGPLPVRSIPSTLHASLIARLDRLGSARDIAQIAAAIGVEFSYRLIAAVAALPEQELNAGLAQLVAAELIFQRGAPPDASYRFKHTLVQDAAYASLLRSRRQFLHGQIAATLEDRFPGVASSAPATLGHHYAEAGVHDKAASYWSKAGRLSLDRSAMVEATVQLERALGLLAELPDTAERRKKEVDLRLMMFQAYLTRGEIEQLTETLVAAVDSAKALGDERRLAIATAQLAAAQWLHGDHVAAAASARFVLDHAKGPDNLTLQLSGTYTLANALHGQGRLDEAIALHREMIGTLAQLRLEDQRLGWPGLPSVMSRAFLSWFLIEAGQFEAARGEIEQGCALADAARQPYSQVLIHAGEGLYHLRRGYPELAVPILDATLKMCQRVFTMEAMLAGWLGAALVEAGRPAEALAVTEESFRRRAHHAGGMYTWFYLFKAIGEAHAALGNAADALAWLDKAIQVTRDSKESLHYAQGLKSRGDIRLRLALSVEAASGDLDEARRIGEQLGLLPLVAECDLSLARARERAGQHQEARRLASRAAEAFRALGLERHLAEAERLAT
ncbi:MAG TPA: AAA family ATPase [Hyphomicrobiaceae bacterium]|jgi:class 3 adenylate cyclase/tetratricopeptide (TPR) repeat protein|nr:AAA family ATPase [Hyphomicrobiaceae bacterium]